MRRVLLLLIVIAGCVGVGVPTRAITPPKRALLSRDLQLHQRLRPHERARVIIRGDAAALNAVAARHRVRLVRTLNSVGVFEANAAELETLATDRTINHLSGDAVVRSAMTVSNKSTAADQTRKGTSGLLGLIGSVNGVTGQGIGVALLDSGVSSHKALGTKVVARVSFATGDTATVDEFGHGTHIAGIITGAASAATYVTSSYAGGIAPGANIVSVRVLNDQGLGYTSDVIAGLDWVIANKSRYNIRVANLSLGHTVTEPVAIDPLCAAVERAYRAGIVVVASAGNRGKDDNGTPILGGVTSPGNSPYAITVGALNTWSTVSRSDDSVTTYSSRGPTRYDLGVKPDVAAPGNKVVSLEVPGSYIARTYPTTHVAGSGTNAYARLSGTSMAAGVVSGGIALLLQGTPSLTPAQVKLLVQTGSTYMVSDGLMAAGAGSVNFWSSRRASVNGLDDLLGALPLIGGLLTQPGGVVFWDSGTMSERMYAGSGIRLLGLLDLVGVLLNPGRLEWGVLNLVGSSNPIPQEGANHILWGDVTTWTTDEHILWGDSITTPEGQHILWGDSQYTEGYHILWGDSVRPGDER